MTCRMCKLMNYTWQHWTYWALFGDLAHTQLDIAPIGVFLGPYQVVQHHLYHSRATKASFGGTAKWLLEIQIRCGQISPWIFKDSIIPFSQIWLSLPSRSPSLLHQLDMQWIQCQTQVYLTDNYTLLMQHGIIHDHSTGTWNHSTRNLTAQSITKHTCGMHNAA